MMSTYLGQSLLLMGLVLLVVGGLLMLAPHIPFIGRLPGDLSFNVGGVRVFAPLATCIIISIVLTALLNLIPHR